MSFIEMAMDEIQESTLLPEGTYDLTIKRADIVPGKKNPNSQIVRVIIEFDGEPDADDMFHFLALPHPDDEPRSKKFKEIQVKRFLHWFGIPMESSGFAIADFPGSRANLAVLVDEYEGRQSNKLADLPRLPNE